jgi:hypothetical protein
MILSSTAHRAYTKTPHGPRVAWSGCGAAPPKEKWRTRVCMSMKNERDLDDTAFWHDAGGRGDLRKWLVVVTVIG